MAQLENDRKIITEVIKEVAIVTRKSQKTGRPYQALELVFANDYVKMIFLDQAEMFLVDSLANN